MKDVALSTAPPTKFGIRGKPYEKVNYQTPQQHVLRDTSTGEYVNSVTLSARDKNGEIFLFQRHVA